MKKVLSIATLMLMVFSISSCCGGGNKGKKECCESKKEKSCCEESKSCCTKEMKVVITAYVEIKQDKVDKFLGQVADLLDKSRIEEGNIAYNLFGDLNAKNKFVFVEEWKSQAAVETHFATEHFKSFGALLEEVAVSPANIKIFEVAAEK